MILTGEGKAGFARFLEPPPVLPFVQPVRGDDRPDAIRVSLTKKNAGGFPLVIADTGILPCPQASGLVCKFRLFRQVDKGGAGRYLRQHGVLFLIAVQPPAVTGGQGMGLFQFPGNALITVD